MGACICPLEGSDGPSQPPNGPLFFHPYLKGSQVIMDESHCIASRTATFCNGIVFSSRPIELYEKVTLKILKEESRWTGGLRVGFTWQDPSLLEPSVLPPYICPDLVNQGRCRAGVLPEECEAEGTIVSFWVDNQGYVYCSTNEKPEGFLVISGVLVTSPLWAVVDIYGRTKALQLLDPSSLPTNADELSLLQQSESTCGDFLALPEECAVCFGQKANTVMLPCCHANFCSHCSLEIFHTTRCCPLCRQEVKKIIPISVLAKGESPEVWLE
ncbi:E3 ubiquitin-protein ligase NEURL3 isoform X2 [Zootoca vivipara]|uniref:E3 ubiquitin-protein ligase NEURL3 isoform X2 n=1 Tax=Zootoca vivipara TaxID=8524 RepID=UPI00158FA3B1|nr:E3 ubiquitin-protein ligase NEURL3 isoform X2 [Zootoca vivipara]